MSHICYQSAQVKASINQWETWTQLKFPDSGEYVIPGALTPITIDYKNREGIYNEPNVWVYYPIDA